MLTGQISQSYRFLTMYARSGQTTMQISAVMTAARKPAAVGFAGAGLE